MISDNLVTLRKLNGMSQEEVAEVVGISRQALAKWESGETIPDVEKSMKLAQLYNVTLDDLVNYSSGDALGLPIPPKGKHLFGMVTVGDKGQIVIPKKAREIFDISPGDKLLVLGDENQGIAIIHADNVVPMVSKLKQIRKTKEKFD